MKRRQALTANRANFNSRFLHLLCMTLFFLHGLLQLLLHFLVCFFSSFLFSNARFFFLQQQNTSADEFLHDRGTVKNQRMEDVTDLFVFNLALFCDALLQLLLLHGIYSFGLLQSVHEIAQVEVDEVHRFTSSSRSQVAFCRADRSLRCCCASSLIFASKSTKP